ncbi:MAG TPA: hypothetical protein VIJ31_05280 [Acidothermaceae bacterium]
MRMFILISAQHRDDRPAKYRPALDPVVDPVVVVQYAVGERCFT